MESLDFASPRERQAELIYLGTVDRSTINVSGIMRDSIVKSPEKQMSPITSFP